MLPPGLRYVDSWVDVRLDRCFQIMETDDPRLFDEWVAHWSDLVTFEIVPVIDSTEAAGGPWGRHGRSDTARASIPRRRPPR